MDDLENGYVVPERCTTTGIQHMGKCNFYCKGGYYLEGQKEVQCRNKKFQTGFKMPVCHKGFY